jgi:Family of unknown function (DUF5677)
MPHPEELRIQKALTFATKLCELVAGHLPKVSSTDGRYENWQTTSAVFVARAGRSLQSVFALYQGGYYCDASTVMRSLFEHVATFAWLAIDPPKHLKLWIRSDAEECLKAHNQMFDVTKENLIDDASIAQYRAIVAEGPERAPNIVAMTNAADVHWSSKLPHVNPGPKESGGFAGLYRVAYRWTSTHAHPSPRGLDSFVQVPEAGVVLVDGEGWLTAEIFTMAPTIYWLGLAIAADVLGWPDADQLTQLLLGFAPDAEEALQA